MSKTFVKFGGFLGSKIPGKTGTKLVLLWNGLFDYLSDILSIWFLIPSFANYEHWGYITQFTVYKSTLYQLKRVPIRLGGSVVIGRVGGVVCLLAGIATASSASILPCTGRQRGGDGCEKSHLIVTAKGVMKDSMFSKKVGNDFKRQ